MSHFLQDSGEAYTEVNNLSPPGMQQDSQLNSLTETVSMLLTRTVSG